MTMRTFKLRLDLRGSVVVEVTATDAATAASMADDIAMNEEGNLLVKMIRTDNYAFELFEVEAVTLHPALTVLPRCGLAQTPATSRSARG